MSGDLADNTEIIRAKKRRLQSLQLQAARYGINTPPEVLIEIEDLVTEIKQLEGAQPSQQQELLPPSPTQGRWLRFAQKNELVNALLACPSISDHSSRAAIIRQLQPEIASRIMEDSRPNIHVLNIVDTCQNFPGALEELIAMLRAFEGSSMQMRELDAVLARILPGFSGR